MKKYILAILIIAVGYGMFEALVSSKDAAPQEEFRPPAPHEITQNPDGTFTINIDESLNQKSK